MAYTMKPEWIAVYQTQHRYRLALEQIALLAEYGTTGPGKCASKSMNAKQATAFRLALSTIARDALTKGE